MPSEGRRWPLTAHHRRHYPPQVRERSLGPAAAASSTGGGLGSPWRSSAANTAGAGGAAAGAAAGGLAAAWTDALDLTACAELAPEAAPSRAPHPAGAASLTELLEQCLLCDLRLWARASAEVSDCT